MSNRNGLVISDHCTVCGIDLDLHTAHAVDNKTVVENIRPIDRPTDKTELSPIASPSSDSYHPDAEAISIQQSGDRGDQA